MTKHQQKVSKAKVDKELHLHHAQATGITLKNLTTCKRKPDEIHMISVDLQQTLPILKLSTQPAFYLRGGQYRNHDCRTNV